MHRILDNMVVDGEDIGVELLEFFTVTRSNGPSVYLGPSLTQPKRTSSKMELVKRNGRVFAVKMADDAPPQECDGEDDDEDAFEEMMNARQAGLSDEERVLEEDEEREEEKEAHNDDEEEDNVKSETDGDDDEAMDPEERRKMRKQRRRLKGDFAHNYS